jgi:hypothetical protein
MVAMVTCFWFAAPSEVLVGSALPGRPGGALRLAGPGPGRELGPRYRDVDRSQLCCRLLARGAVRQRLRP